MKLALLFRGEQVLAVVRYDLDSNEIEVTRGNYRYKESLTHSKAAEGVTVLKRGDAVAGVKLSDVLSEPEKTGALGEESFKRFLDNNAIPYLYIGQGPVGIERSEALLSGLGSRRPDFLVNLPNLGYMFVDVKSRQKVGFADDPDQYYYLSEDEIDGLVTLHRSLLIAVWVAFVDREQNASERFFLASVPSIDEYRRALRDELRAKSPEAALATELLRIPDSLLTTADRQLSFRVGLQPFGRDQIEKSAASYRGLHRSINSRLFEAIRTKGVTKSKTIEECAASLPYCLSFEVRAHLEAIIERGDVVYEPRKPLKLVGE
jgi:hypothetical protein